MQKIISKHHKQIIHHTHTYPNNEFISKINIPMEVSSMAYDLCIKTYNASSQNSLSNSDKDSNTLSSIIYSAASCTLLNYQNVPSSNDKIMEAHKSTHNTHKHFKYSECI